MSELKTLPDTDWEKTLRVGMSPDAWDAIDAFIAALNESNREKGYHELDRAELAFELLQFLVIAIRKPDSIHREIAERDFLFARDVWRRLDT